MWPFMKDRYAYMLRNGITMVLSYSITNGIGMGIISFVLLELIIYLIDVFRGAKAKMDSTWVTWVIFILFLVYFLVPTVL